MAMLTDLQKMVAGMFMPASSTRNPQNVSGSIYDLARQQEQARAMQRLGGNLMAAAVPQTPLMRAQAMQNAFSNIGGSSTDTYNTAQMLLAEQKARQQAARDAEIDSAYNAVINPQNVSESVPLPSASPDLSTFGPRVQAPSAQTPTSQSEIGALISPAQAAIVAPQGPSAANIQPRRSSDLTPAQIKLVEGLAVTDGKAAALKKAAELRYENSQPKELKGEFAQTVTAMKELGYSQGDIDAYKNRTIYGQKTEFDRDIEALATLDPTSEEYKFRRARLEKQTSPEPLKVTRLIEALNNATDPNDIAYLKSALEKEVAPSGMRIETAPDGTVSIVQGDAPAGTSGFAKELPKIWKEKLGSGYDIATSAADDIRTTNRLRGMVDSGVNFGEAGGAYNWLNTQLANMGVVNEDNEVLNTNTYAALVGERVGNIIKLFGSGTGLSNEDRKFAQKIAAADPKSITPAQATKLLEIADEANRYAIRKYNEKFIDPFAEITKDDPTMRAMMYSFTVEMPEQYTPPEPIQEWSVDGTQIR